MKTEKLQLGIVVADFDRAIERSPLVSPSWNGETMASRASTDIGSPFVGPRREPTPIPQTRDAGISAQHAASASFSAQQIIREYAL